METEELRTIKAVGFDIDGTLYPETKLYMRTIGAAVKRPFLSIAYYHARKDLRRFAYDVPFHEEQARLVLKRLGKPAESRHIARMKQKLNTSFYSSWNKHFRHISPFPGTADALAEIQKRGLKLGVLSDFPVGRKLREMKLDSFFSVQLCAEDTGYLKPSTVPFEALAEALEVNPDEMLYVGNSFSKDIIGAERTGMYTACFDKDAPRFPSRVQKSDDGIPNFSFSHYDDLSAFIDELFQVSN